jgi:hypothetical protein
MFLDAIDVLIDIFSYPFYSDKYKISPFSEKWLSRSNNRIERGEV